MVPDPSFKYFGLVSIALTWIGLLFLIFKWKGNKSMSFSLHAAQTKAGQIYYFILFSITLPLFFLFIWRWYKPFLELSNLFIVVVLVGISGQILAIIVPSTGGIKERIHDFGAYTMAFMLIPASFLIALSHVTPEVKTLAFLCTSYMLVSIILFFAIPSLSSRYLYFQAAYILVFHTVILTSTYIT